MSQDKNTPLAKLESVSNTITNLEEVNQILYWDGQVMMPEGGTPARSEQRSTISSLKHEALASDETAASFEAVDDEELDPRAEALVRELGWDHRRARRVPESVVSEQAKATSDAQPAWREAHNESDFDSFVPALERVIGVTKRYADHADPDAGPVETLFNEDEPYLELEQAERILDQLKSELVPLISEVRDSDVALDQAAFTGHYPEEEQMALARDVLDAVEYEWEHGRLDTAPHPFAGGTPFDARITTRFDEENLLSAISTTLHEFGHASYSLGLPESEFGSVLGRARGHAVHESQSRFWENHVGRTRAFWEFALPLIRERFDGFDDVTPEAAYRSANLVYEDNPIRVEADELTYHMHILLRFEIERALLTDEIDVADVPDIWNEKSEEYLGITPDNDAEGPLQDIHWSMGSLVNFQNYTLGSVLAAQIDSAMRTDLGDIDARIANGEFGAIRTWLTDNIHSHGRRLPTDELIREATGEPLTAEYFIDYVTEKYSNLYDL